MTLPMERVEDRILSIRRHRVMLDADLAVLYEEWAYLKSQIVISNGWGG